MPRERESVAALHEVQVLSEKTYIATPLPRETAERGSWLPRGAAKRAAAAANRRQLSPRELP